MKKECFIQHIFNLLFKSKNLPITLIGVLLLSVSLTVPTLGAEKSDNKNISSIGSGSRYVTTVERQTRGELSAEDFRQVSTLASHITEHLNGAVRYLEDNNLGNATSEVDKAKALTKVIRDMLPTTTVTTIVKDAKGNEVYRNKNNVQDDLVPIYEQMTAMDVVEPIVEAKKREVEVKGIKLADSEVIRTSVLLDLGYVERKLTRAQALMAKEPQKSLDELKLAQTHGIRFSVAKEDNALVKAQRALRLAERMVNEKKYEGAESNLRLARVHLETYKTVTDESRGKEVDKLQKDIDRLFGTLEKADSESKVRELWTRVTNWFSVETGQSHQTSQTEKKGN
jgi:hypothetical protein